MRVSDGRPNYKLNTFICMQTLNVFISSKLQIYTILLSHHSVTVPLVQVSSAPQRGQCRLQRPGAGAWSRVPIEAGQFVCEYAGDVIGEWCPLIGSYATVASLRRCIKMSPSLHENIHYTYTLIICFRWGGGG